MTRPLQDIAAAYESAMAARIAYRFGTTPELVEMATSDAPFDLAIAPRELLRSAAARASLAPEPMVDIARVGIGVAVRRGAPRPDIATPEALRRALLSARSIATIPASATGVLLDDIYRRLGIAAAMQARIRAQSGPARVVEAVASGEAEIAVFLLNVIASPHLDVVGPLPRELQQEVVYVAGVSARTLATPDARAFIAHVRSPAAAAVIASYGLVPG